VSSLLLASNGFITFAAVVVLETELNKLCIISLPLSCHRPYCAHFVWRRNFDIILKPCGFLLTIKWNYGATSPSFWQEILS